MDETAYIVGSPTDDPEQFDRNMGDADASASQVRDLLSRVKSVRGHFHVVGIGAFDGLAQPSTDRKPAKSRGKGKKGKRKGKSSSQKTGQSPSLGTPGILPKNHRPHVPSPPMSKKHPTEAGASRGGPHHAPQLRPDQCMLCRQIGQRATECPNKGKATALPPGKGAFGTYALRCVVFDAMCYGASVEETEQAQDKNDIEDFVAFSIKSLEGFATLDGGVTKIFLFNQ